MNGRDGRERETKWEKSKANKKKERNAVKKR